MRAAWALLAVAGLAIAQQPAELTTLDTPSPPKYVLSFAQTGNVAAAVCRDDMVRIWMLPSGKLTRTIDPGKRWMVVTAISSDGALVAGADWAGKYTVWSAGNGERAFEVQLDHYPQAIGFSPDGKLFAIAPANEPAQVYSIESGRKLFELPQTFGGAQAVAFSRDGSRIVTADSDTLVRVFDARNGEVLWRFTDFLLEPFTAAFTADGKSLLTAGADKQVALLNAAQGTVMRKSSKLADPVANLDVSPDGSLAAAWLMHAADMSQPAPVLISEIASGRMVQLWRPPGPVLGSAWTGGQSLLAAVRMGESVHVWRVR